MIQSSAKGSIILITGQAASTLISALGSILVARIIGSSSYGLLAIAQIPINIADVFIQNGVSQAIINFIVEARSEGEEDTIASIIRAGFIINLFLGLIVTSGLYFLAGYLSNQVYSNPELNQLIQILSFSVLARSISSTSASVLIGFEDMKKRISINILYSGLKSFIGPVLVYLGYGVIGAAYGRMTPYLFSSIIAFILVFSKLGNKIIPTVSDMENIRRIISFSYPLFFSNLLSRSLSKALNFILPLYVSATLMGNYSAANTFTMLITFFIKPISTATFPLFSKLKPKDSVFEYVFQNVIKYETIIVYPIATAVIGLSDHLVQILYGNDYPNTPFFLRILMLNYIFVGFGNSASSRLLNSQKQTQVALKRTIIYLSFGIPIGLYLIPRYGIIGYQATNLLAPVGGLFYVLWWMKKNMDVNIDIRSTVKIFISSLFGYSACRILTSNIDLNPIFELFAGGAILALVYLISLLLSGALTKSNISDIYSIVSRYKAIKWFIEPTFIVLKKLARKN
jgi:O-antigen/teichoic acid export membrane protein